MPTVTPHVGRVNRIILDEGVTPGPDQHACGLNDTAPVASPSATPIAFSMPTPQENPSPSPAVAPAAAQPSSSVVNVSSAANSFDAGGKGICESNSNSGNCCRLHANACTNIFARSTSCGATFSDSHTGRTKPNRCRNTASSFHAWEYGGSGYSSQYCPCSSPPLTCSWSR